MHKEAFVYVWQNIKDKKKYIGYHKGSIHDGYDTSSTSKEMNDAFARGELVREIIATGSVKDMIALERKMLLDADARNNDEYYNKSNGGGSELKNFIKPSLDTLQENIMYKQYPVEMVQKEVVAAYKKFQVRFNEIDSQHVKTLRDKIDDLNGDTSDFEPVHVLLDYFGKSEHLLLDGNHRVIATMNSKRAQFIPVQYIPKSAWSPFSKLELKTLANRLNPLPDKPALSANKDDAVKFLIERYEDGEGVNVKSDQNAEELLKWGFTKKQINAYMKIAQKQIDNFTSIPNGAVWINWPVTRNKELKSIVEQNRDKNTMAISASSGGFRLDTLLKESTYHLTKTRAVVVMYHPSPSAKKQWDREYLPQYEKVIKHRLSGFNVSFQYLQTIDYNAGLQDSATVV